MRIRQWHRRLAEAVTGLVVTAAVIGAPVAPPLVDSRAPAGRTPESGRVTSTAANPSVVGGAVGDPGQVTAAWVQQENAKPGTSDWRLNGPSGPGQMEGFAGAVSATAGDTVDFYVSTKASTFHLEAYRMGFYAGLGARLVFKSVELPGGLQGAAKVAPKTNMVEAPWHASARVSIDAQWVPGVYLVKLVGNGNQQYYVPLTIRDDASHAAYLVQNSVTTWQAYNVWGGYDLYEGRSGRTGTDFEHRARVVSFDRPYAMASGSGDFLGSELPLVSLVESLGLDVTYWTDVDLHEHPERVLQHRALLSLGHDEYWSTAMRTGAERARDAGVNLAFMGANAVYRHIRLEPSAIGPDRHEVDYKSAHEDPMTRSDPAEATVDWRDPPVRKPESPLIGDLYDCNPVKADMVVADPTAWVFEGTGIEPLTRLKDVVGSEYDKADPVDGPKNVQILAHSPVTCHGKHTFSDMTYYTAPSGAGVWATGTNAWIAKLSAPCDGDPCVGSTVVRVTENVLRVFGRGPAGLTHPSVPSGVPRYGHDGSRATNGASSTDTTAP